MTVSATNIPEALVIAVTHHRAGRLTEAEALCRQILSLQPDHVNALHVLGRIAYQMGHTATALELMRQAIRLSPGDPALHSNLGEVYRGTGRLDEAVASYEKALGLAPDLAAAHNNLGLAFAALGKYEWADAAYRRAIQLNPGYVEAHNNRGNTLSDQGRLQEAMASFHEALRLNPHYAIAHSNLGAVLIENGQWEEGIVACREAIRLDPHYADAYNNLGNALKNAGLLDDAIAAFQRAVEVRTDFVEAYNNLGMAWSEKGELERGLSSLRAALEKDPGFANTHGNLGILLLKASKLDDAILACRRAIDIKPDYAEAHNALGQALAASARLDEAVASYRQAIELKPGDSGIQSNLLGVLHYHPNQSERAVIAARSRWDQQFGLPLKQRVAPHLNAPDSNRRLRIGYVSRDLCDHVVGRNLAPLFRCHDHGPFEIFCYSGAGAPDRLTQSFQGWADHWRATSGASDEKLAEIIRRDSIDVLVDLAQHTSNNRLLTFARQPAPVQVSFAGYPESTGLGAISHRISDRYLEQGWPIGPGVPKEQVCLIDSFWCYDPCGLEVEVSPLPAAEKGHVTYGSMNNFCKINESVLRLWAKVLRQPGDSRLILLSCVGSHRQRTLSFLRGEGIEPHRVEFVEPCPREAYLELYHRLDMVLDPFPYNGHTTSLDALWMGVPVVSLAGVQSVSRAGWSQLSNLGLTELVAFSEDAYVDIAARLAHDLPRLRELRGALRQRMQSSSLMDATRFTRSIESAYRTMWQQWCHKQSLSRP